MGNKVVLLAVKVALIYAVFAGLWIFLSDSAVNYFFADPHLLAVAQTHKGLAFVVITAILLFLLVLKDNKEIEHANDIDALTGFLSFNLFIRTVQNQLDQVSPNQQVLLGCLDIDNFKHVYQGIGYERTDAFIKDLAQEINKTIIPGSFVSRLHADQFAFFTLLPAKADMNTYVRSFQRVFAQQAKAHALDITSSMGVALFPDDGYSAQELMEAATGALALAKQDKNCIQYHDKALTLKITERRQLLADLQQAIKAELLTVVYQPKYAFPVGEMCGVEVLVRWRHPQHGFIAPEVFIPLAEENGLIGDITKLVIAKASHELEHSLWLGEPLKHVSVNVSAEEFNNNQVMQQLISFIKQKKLASYLRIEITETATLTDIRQSAEVISQLHGHGLTLAIDDFGTGYTSLAMLKDLTVDEIKIDRSFVCGLENDQRSRTIVNAIIAMANSFDINLVAEGVETKAQLELLQAMGCKQMQGFYLARPMPIEELVKHINQ